MSLVDKISSWNNKKVLLIGDALIDKYIFGYADRISPDAPVPNVKIENSSIYIGATGLVLQFIQSLGGIPEICTIIGNDFEGEYFLKKVNELKIDSSGILIDDKVITPQITRIKAMNQHLLRLETDYNGNISSNLKEKFDEIIRNKSSNIDSIVILDYGLGGLLDDLFIRKLMIYLKDNLSHIPVVVRPTKSNYYLYEDVELIKMNLQKALDTFSIDCCNETSVTIAGKRILNASKCKNLILNYLESDSYLFSKEIEAVEKFEPILREPVRSYVAVGSVVMAVLGLSFASGLTVFDSVKLALLAAAFTAVLPPVEFYDSKKFSNYLMAELDR